MAAVVSFPPPNPPDGLAVAAAAGNEPRGGEKGRGRASGGGAWAPAARTMGERAGGGASPCGIRPGPSAAGASANSPRSRSVAPFKGEDVAVPGDGLGIYFQSVDTYGAGPRAGSLCVGDRRNRVTESGSPAGEAPVAAQAAERRWPCALGPGVAGLPNPD